MITIEAVLEKIDEQRWVCPQPARWNKLHELIPNNCFTGNLEAPGAPLILSSWWEATPAEKKARFIEHLRWAESQGALEAVYTLMLNLHPKDWLQG